MDEQGLAENKTELIELINGAWSKLNALVDSVPEDRLSAPGPEGWAVKDHLSHIGGWERMSVAAIKGESEEAAVGVDQWTGEWDTDRFNDILYQKWRGESPAAIRAYLEESHRQMMELVNSLDDAGLRSDLPNEPGRPNVDKIAGNTYMHFDEHRDWIKQLFASR